MLEKYKFRLIFFLLMSITILFAYLQLIIPMLIYPMFIIFAITLFSAPFTAIDLLNEIIGEKYV